MSVLPPPLSDDARAELERLIAVGLTRYRGGDADGALVAWEQALAIAPGDLRALGYVDYVRQLQAEAAAAAPPEPEPAPEPVRPVPPVSTQRLPLPPEPTGDEPLFTIELDAELPPLPPGTLDLGYEDSDDAIARTNRSTVDLPADLLNGLLARDAEDSGEETLGGYHPGQHKKPTLDLTVDFGPREPTGERTIERRATPAPAPRHTLESPGGVPPARPVTRPPPVARSAEPAPAPRPVTRATTPPPVSTAAGSVPPRPRTSSGGYPISPPPPPPPQVSLGDLDLDLPGSPLELGIETSIPGKDPIPPAPPAHPDERLHVHVEELRLPLPITQSLRTIDLGDDDHAPPLPPMPTRAGPADRLIAEVDRDRPASETPDDIARRRITRFIDRARAAAAAGETDTIAVALELAQAEAPDSAVAQKLIHKHRDTLLDCYYRFFGSLDRRPVVCGDLTALSPAGGRGIAPRAAFLLSRIDGTMTYDELLDVAGMSRLEACRHLAHLIGRGLVRSA